MSNDVAIFQQNTDLQLASSMKALAATGMVDDLAGGVSGNYAIVSIRGGKWRVKYQGEEQPIVDANGEPMPSLEVVLIKANPFLTKQYFENGYEEGDTASPVCFSTDGKAPAPNAPNPQHTNCALCPQNKFGSRVTPAGVEVKACQDNRKMAVVPLADLHNETFGGPMLFRVPASALKGLAQFGQTMKGRGYPYNAVAVRLGFDLEVSYPKPTFKAIRPLTEEEAATVLELYSSPAVENVLGGDAAAGHAAAGQAASASAPAKDPDFEVPPPAATPAAPAPAAAKPTHAKPAATAKPAAKTATGGATFGKPAASAAPAASPAAPAAPARQPRKAPAAAAAAPPAQPAAPAPAADPEVPAEAAGGNLDNDIASILAELNGAAA